VDAPHAKVTAACVALLARRFDGIDGGVVSRFHGAADATSGCPARATTAIAAHATSQTKVYLGALVNTVRLTT